MSREQRELDAILADVGGVLKLLRRAEQAEAERDACQRVVDAARAVANDAALKIEYPEDVAIVEELNDALAALAPPKEKQPLEGGRREGRWDAARKVAPPEEKQPDA